MKKGLVFGKFLPLHKGHLALIEFALKHCDHLYVCICYTVKESIDGVTRKTWLDEALAEYSNITIIAFEYDDNVLSNTSSPSRDVSKAWSIAFKKTLPEVQVVFTSEPYGEYVAEYMGVQHILFDEKRKLVPVSGSQIREEPLTYWDYIPENLKYWFVKKICIVGSESTGKSILTEKLAAHFNTCFVPEMAREIIENTDECTYDDLLKIAELHAKTIKNKLPQANKLLFVDTDLNITKSYCEFLFNRELIVDSWIDDINKFDLYLFLEPDCEFVQDGTRLSIEERNRLSINHRNYFTKKGIPVISISGSWQNRFETACKAITDSFNTLS